MDFGAWQLRQAGSGACNLPEEDAPAGGHVREFT